MKISLNFSSLRIPQFSVKPARLKMFALQGGLYLFEKFLNLFEEKSANQKV